MTAMFVLTLGSLSGLSVSANQLTFSVEPVLPDNQVNNKDGFFNIALAPGQSEDLHLKYSNDSGKTVTVTTKVASATTNINGVVEYGPKSGKADKSLKYNLKDFVDVPEEVVVKSGESKDVVVHVTMPDSAFPGIIAGGLTFSDKAADAANQKTSAKTTAIKNIYGFQLGLLMRQNTDQSNVFTQKIVEADGLKLHQVVAGQVNYRNVINASLQNPLPVYINQMAVHARVYDAKGKKLLYESKNADLQMAPNTNFKYPIALGNGKRIKPGKYRLKMTVYADKDDQKKYYTKEFNNKRVGYQYRWKFDREFTVSGKDATDLNKRDVTIQRIDWISIIIILAILFALLALALWFILWKRRKDNDEVTIEEEVLNQVGDRILIQRKTTMKEYKKLVKQGNNVRLVTDK